MLRGGRHFSGSEARICAACLCDRFIKLSGLSLSLSLSWHSIASDLPVADGPPDSRVGWRKGRVAGGLCWVR